MGRSFCDSFLVDFTGNTADRSARRPHPPAEPGALESHFCLGGLCRTVLLVLNSDSTNTGGEMLSQEEVRAKNGRVLPNLDRATDHAAAICC